MFELNVDSCSVVHAKHIPSKVIFIDSCEIISRQASVLPEYTLLRVKIEDEDTVRALKRITEEAVNEWFGADIITVHHTPFIITVRATSCILEKRASVRSGAIMLGVPPHETVTKMWISLSNGSSHTIADEYQSLMWDCMSLVLDF